MRKGFTLEFLSIYVSVHYSYSPLCTCNFHTIFDEHSFFIIILSFCLFHISVSVELDRLVMDSKISLESLRLDLDQMKLKLPAGTMSSADFDLLLFIVDGFFEILKFSEKYPVFNDFIQEVCSESQINTGINSQSTYARVLDVFRSTEEKPHRTTINDSELTYTCDICDEKIMILNNDLLFSLDLHEQTPHHKEVLKDFQNFHTKAAPSNSNDYTTTLNGKLHCTLCNVAIPNCGLVDHNRGYKHRLQLGLEVTSSNSTAQSKEKLVADRIGKSRKSVNEACMIFKRKGLQYCILCRVQFTNPSQSQRHLIADGHRLLVQEQLLTATANSQLFTTSSALFDVGIIFINKKGDRHCFLCDAKLGKQVAKNYVSHLKGQNHEKKLKLQTEYNNWC